MRIRKRKVPLPLSMLSPVPITSSFFSSDPATAPPPPWLQLLSEDGAGGPYRNTDATNSASPISPSEIRRKNTDDQNIAGGAAVASASSRKGSLSSSSSTDHDHPMGQLQSPICSPSGNDIGVTWSSSSRKKSSWFSPSSLLDNGLDSSSGNKRDDVKKPPLNKKRAAGGGGGSSSNSTSSRVMEAGSRCSRVNGRGWRCSQPTLVGYALCEHHLGKARIRTISTTTTSTIRQLGCTTGSTHPTKLPSPSSDNVDRTEQKQMMPSNVGDAEEEDDDNYQKKSKLGSVKARSISSLLDQTDHNAVSSLLLLPHHAHKPSS